MDYQHTMIGRLTAGTKGKQEPVPPTVTHGLAVPCSRIFAPNLHWWIRHILTIDTQRKRPSARERLSGDEDNLR